MSVLETTSNVYGWMYYHDRIFPFLTRDLHACSNNYVLISIDHGDACFFQMYSDSCLSFITESNEEPRAKARF